MPGVGNKVPGSDGLMVKISFLTIHLGMVVMLIFLKIYRTKKKKIISKPIYDLSSDGLKGISLNFSRLGRLRPGYGYDLIKDVTNRLIIPKNDGIFLIDIIKNKSKLVVSFEQLNNLFPVDSKFDDCEQYFNHLSFNPSGNKFLFYHIISKNKLRKLELFITI